MLLGNIALLVHCVGVALGMSTFAAIQSKAQSTDGHGILDAHVHIWGAGEAPFPYAVGAPLPPAGMQASSGNAALLYQLDCAGVAGALIIQPIHYMFDHSYVARAIVRSPRLKGMALMDPLAGPRYLESLKQQGFVGVRFNPALWPKRQEEAETTEMMSDARGARLFAQCGALGMPVGFMCFKGLSMHAHDIRALLMQHPETRVVIDHWGFFLQNGAPDEESWAALLALAAFPQVHVKVSAAFRNVPPGQDQAGALKSRFVQLVEAFTPSRLLWGSDWPYVSAAAPSDWPSPPPSTAYAEASVLVPELGWGCLDEKGVKRVLRGTTEDLFGPWP